MMTGPAQAWTPEEDAILRRMWMDGRTHTEIAAAIVAAGGPPRNRHMIHGRRQKIGLAARHIRLQPKSTKIASQSQARPISTGRQTKEQAAAAAVNGVGGAPMGVNASPNASQVENPITEAPGARIVPLIEIRHGECRFVVEERPALMCGAPVHVPGEAWCRFHRRIVYAPRGKTGGELRRVDAAAANPHVPDSSKRLFEHGW